MILSPVTTTAGHQAEQELAERYPDCDLPPPPQELPLYLGTEGRTTLTPATFPSHHLPFNRLSLTFLPKPFPACVPSTPLRLLPPRVSLPTPFPPTRGRGLAGKGGEGSHQFLARPRRTSTGKPGSQLKQRPRSAQARFLRHRATWSFKSGKRLE